MTLDRILIVDDEPITLELLSVQLNDRFEVITSTNGADGLEILRHDVPFAAVISDLSMPGMDGVEFLRLVKSTSPHTVRLIMTAGSGFDGVVQSINESEVFRFIPKPFHPEFTREVLAKAVEKYRFDMAARNGLSRAIIGTVAMLNRFHSKLDARLNAIAEPLIDLAALRPTPARLVEQHLFDCIDAIELDTRRDAL